LGKKRGGEGNHSLKTINMKKNAWSVKNRQHFLGKRRGWHSILAEEAFHFLESERGPSTQELPPRERKGEKGEKGASLLAQLREGKEGRKGL